MDFKCYVCFSTFKLSNEAIDHLKKSHYVKENQSSNILCIVNKQIHCGKTFKTFSGLRRHIVKCENIKSTNNFEQIKLSIDLANNTPQDECVDELSEAIEHELNLNTISHQNDVVCSETPIEFVAREKSEFELANEEAVATLDEFCMDIIGMNLSEKKTNDVFLYSEKLVRSLQKFNVRLITDDNNQMSAVQAIESSSNFFVEEIKKHNTSYKRAIRNQKKELFVCPKELSIGTRWERKRLTDACGAQIFIPQVKQNTYQYVPVMDTIQSLFRSKEFCDMYFNGNTVAA